jgi:hypothetical protein
MNPFAQPDHRQELHNVSVDEEVAGAGACAQVHVPTGRTCTLRHHHQGSCEFVPRERVKESLTEHHITGR